MWMCECDGKETFQRPTDLCNRTFNLFRTCTLIECQRHSSAMGIPSWRLFPLLNAWSLCVGFLSHGYPKLGNPRSLSPCSLITVLTYQRWVMTWFSTSACHMGSQWMTLEAGTGVHNAEEPKRWTNVAWRAALDWPRVVFIGIFYVFITCPTTSPTVPDILQTWPVLSIYMLLHQISS